MSNLTNLYGKAGEYLCIAEFMRPVMGPSGPRLLFDAHLIGGNAPTFDYIIYLVDATGDRTGAFFFVQVKTTSKTPAAGIGYPVAFSALDVRRALATKVPFFVCAVDRAVTGAEKFFIKGVDSKRTKGIARLAPVHDLTTDAVKNDLYDEVELLWAAQVTPVLTKKLI